jgi:uncharacterized protein YjbI with pentapeptide repeats
MAANRKTRWALPRPPEPGGALQPATPDERSLRDDDLRTDLLLEDADLSATVASGVELKRFELRRTTLAGSRLDQLDLEHGFVVACDLATVTTRSATLDRVQFDDSRLVGAVFADCRLHDVLFRDCRLQLTSFRFGRLTRVRFERCELREADFQGATVAASFAECDLTGAQLSQADLNGSTFRGCRLGDLHGWDALRGAQVAWEDLLELATGFAAAMGIEVRDDLP